MRLQAGDEVHVVLRQHFQQRVERLAELRIVLRGDEGTWRHRLTYGGILFNKCVTSWCTECD